MSAERAGLFVENAYQLTALGWALIRLDGKIPKGRDWQHTEPLRDPHQAAGMWAEWGKRWNMGTVLGARKLAVLEYDLPEARTGFVELVADTQPPLCRTGSGKHHAYFAAVNGVTKAARDGLELRVGAHQCVVPPSIHPDTGEPYVWERAPWEVPLPPLPDAVVAYFAGAGEHLRERLQADPEAKVGPGQRRDQVFRLACSLVARGVPPDAILGTARAFNETRCEPPLDDAQVAAQVQGAIGRYDPATALPIPDAEPVPEWVGDNPSSPVREGSRGATDSRFPAIGKTGKESVAVTAPSATHTALVFESAAAFAKKDEPNAEMILGHGDDDAAFVAGGTVVVFGKGGGGKTTLVTDVACHLATGTEWQGLKVPKARRVGVIENDGPRGRFRRKMRAKLAAWTGKDPGDRLQILSEPWGALRLSLEEHRAALARFVNENEVDVLIAGPIVSLGMIGGGTPDEVAKFEEHLQALRDLCERPLLVVLLHHTNQRGQISGAWDRVPDTLIFVVNTGRGTRLTWQKARDSSTLHATTWKLKWAEGMAFAIDDTPEVTEADIEDAILAAAQANPGKSWTVVAKPVKGNAKAKAAIRDRLIVEGKLVNTGTGQAFALWHPDDEPSADEELPF